MILNIFQLNMNYNKVYLSIGSNIGSRIKNIQKSLEFLMFDDNKIVEMSSYYDSEPLYYKKQRNFINIVVLLETKLNEDDLLLIAKNIEVKIGRELNQKKNHERIIDIDILTFNNQEICKDNLIIPHPRIRERKFVLLPWNEISPKFILTTLNKNINTLLNTTKDDSKVIKLN